MRKIRFALSLLFIFLICVETSISVLAADAEFRMMHGEQDAIVVGTIAEATEEVRTEESVEADMEIEDIEVDITDGSASIGIIGGADGPTSIFIAGKLGSGFGVIIGAVVLSVVVIAVVVWKVVRRKRRKK